MRNRLGCLLLLMTALAPVAVAGTVLPGSIEFQRIATREGLPQSSINAMAQDQQGYLWLATQFGLARYDGYQVVTWTTSDAPDSLAENHISDLALADDDHLWAASSFVLHRFNRHTGRAERLLPDIQDFRSDPVWGGMRIAGVADDGTVYVRFGADRLGRASLEDDRIHVLDDATLPPSAAPAVLRGDALLDAQQRLWAHGPDGLKVWREAEATMQVVLAPDSDSDWPHFPLAETRDGHLILGRADGVYRFDPERMRMVNHWRPTAWGASRDAVIAIRTDTHQGVWVGQSDALYRLDLDTEAISEFTFLSTQDNLALEFYIGPLINDGDEVWVPTPHGLLHWHATRPMMAELHRHHPALASTLPSTTTIGSYVLFLDQDRTLWVAGHLGGLARQSPYARRFELIRDEGQDSEVPFSGQNIVRAILETQLDDHGLVWLGLNGAGLRQLRRDPIGGLQWQRSYHSTSPDTQHRLASDAVWSLAHDPHTGLVWVGMTTAIATIDEQSGNIISQRVTAPATDMRLHNALSFSPHDPSLVAATDDGLLVWALSSDRRDLLSEQATAHYFQGRHLRALAWHGDDQLVVVGDNGFGLLEGWGQGQPKARWWPLEQWSPYRNRLMFGLAAHDSEGWWVGGQDTGLAHVTLDGQRDALSARWHGLEEGLADRTVYAILPDASGHLWISSNRGLQRWSPQQLQGAQFLEEDGVQGHEFNNTVAHVGPSGRFYFGGINGANAFFPDQIVLQARPPTVVLSEISINGDRQNLDFSHPVSLLLRHDQNGLDVRYAGLHSSNPGFNRYAFRLLGLESEWVQVGHGREARYAALRPGRYQFEVKAANSDGLWSPPVRLVDITIQAPWYATPLAWLSYVLLVLFGLGLAFVLQRRRRLELQALVDRRTAEVRDSRDLLAQRSQDLEQALASRTHLFANVSHEFRTPLTLIQLSVDKLAEAGADAETIKVARRYLQRMIRMVEQILDLTRLNAGGGVPSAQPWNLSEVVQMLLQSFANLAGSRDITLTADIEGRWLTSCQQEQIEKIVLNLLSNALKFTPRCGQVQVSLKAYEDGVLLAVSDTGPGIPLAEQTLIFERFHRMAMHQEQAVPGAGIGLALVKEAALANGGWVSVDSEVGIGATFKVWLPAWQTSGPSVLGRISAPARSALELGVLEDEQLDESSFERASPDQAAPTAPVLLIIEDNADLRAQLVDWLQPQWQCLEAGDGRTGLWAAIEHLPDVVLTDITMPEMDGLQMLKQLRHHPSTSHIPVLILSAKHDADTRMQGYALQADDVLGKPFNIEELQLRLSRMLEAQKRVRRRLRMDLEAGQLVPERPSFRSGAEVQELAALDHELLGRLERWLVRHFSDPNIEVLDMARAMGVELRVLERKLQSLTGHSPSSLLASVRLREARRLMSDGSLAMSLVAERCGYSDAEALREQLQNSQDR